MSLEHERRQQEFGFTPDEMLWDRMSNERFTALLRDQATTIHQVELSSNAFGEFLFVSVSRPVDMNRVHVTFFGLGYHEGRDRWIKDEWFWYESHARVGELDEQSLTQEEVKAVLNERRSFVQAEAQRHIQSDYGKLFDMVADLTDDDGAMSEIEELSDWFDHLHDE